MADGIHDPPDPRVLLAEERTFLAWHRTALALTAGALALAGLTRTQESAAGPRLAAIGVIVFAGCIAALNDRQHRHARTAITEGRPLPYSRLPLVLTVGVLVISAVAVVLVAAGLQLR